MCRPLSDFVCDDCQRPFTQVAYASRREGGKICDDCAHASELASIASGDAWTIYGPSKLTHGAEVTTWPGRKLGTITGIGAKPHPWTRRSHWGEKYHCDVRMVDGSRWSGWIGEGTASNIKRKK